MSTKVVILTAGIGKRFDASMHKCLTPIQFGEGTFCRLLRQVVQSIAPSDILVVTGHENDAIRAAASKIANGPIFIHNADFANGSSLTSLHAGLSDLWYDSHATGAWVLFADTVYHSSTLKQILESTPKKLTLLGMLEKYGAPDAVGLVTCSKTGALQSIGVKRLVGGHTMLPAVYWPRSCWPDVICGDQQGLSSQWQVVRQYGPDCADVKVVEHGHIQDVDTLADLKRIRKSLVGSDIHAYFRSNICKEERSRDKPDRLDQALFIKTCQSEWHAKVEVSSSHWIAQQTGGRIGFSFAARTGRVVAMEYVQGVRLFDLLRLMKDVGHTYPDLADVANDAGICLLKRSLLRLGEIQKALLTWPLRSHLPAYPQGTHIHDLLSTITKALQLPSLTSLVMDELAEFEMIWNANDAVVPFRDATPKNIMIEIPQLTRSGHADSAERVDLTAAWLRKYDSNTVRIIDYDFTSTEHLTAPEDDIISLLAHQGSIHLGTQVLGMDSRSWPRGIAQLPSSFGLPFAPDLERTARALLVRFLRLGGRKLLYRMVNPVGYEIRFRYDTPNYYFNTLSEQLCTLDTGFSQRWPNILSLLQQIAQGVNRLPGWSPCEPAQDMYIEEHGAGLTYWQESPVEGLLQKS